jgi:hypothetical protein
LLLTPPPVDTIQRRKVLATRDPPIGLDRDFDTTRAYAATVKEVAEMKRVPVVDVWQKVWDCTGHDENRLEKFLIDGLHLTAAGYDVCKLTTMWI